jgi:isocitrate/isopropylmalate dehydrogenase
VREVLKEGKNVTRDLNPKSGVGTTEMTQAIIDRLHASS